MNANPSNIKKKKSPETSETSQSQVPLTPAKRLGRLAGWMSFGVACLIFFTLLKLPEDRIKAYIDGTISAALAKKQISFSTTEGRLSILFGISYTMKDITINFPPPHPPVHIDKIEVAPSLLSLIFSNYGGKLWLENGKGQLSASFSLKNTLFSASYKASKLEIQKLGVLPFLAGVQVAGTLDGNGSFSGDYANPTALEGEGALTFTQISTEPQSIAGFSIPPLSISDAVVEVKAEKGKAVIKTLRVGKPTPTKGKVDDIQAAVTGDVTLAKQLDNSQLNLKIHFTFSENILKSFVLLDTILGAGKQGDGSYSYTLTGPLMAPQPTPGGV